MHKLAIGTHLRRIRIRQNRTIQDIADKCHLSRNTISKIEANKVVPSVATLAKLAKSLGSDVGALLEENGELACVMTPAGQPQENLTQTEKGYHIYPFASEYKNKKMQPFLFVARKGQVKKHHLAHDGEEFLYVLEGRIKFQVGDVEYTLKEGDSLYFDALQKHWVIPASEEAKYLVVHVFS